MVSRVTCEHGADGGARKGLTVDRFDGRSHGYGLITPEDLALAKQSKNPVWTDLKTLKSQAGWYHKEEQVFSVMKYVQSDSGEYLGTIALFVKESSFFDILANAENAQDRQFYLVNDQDQIVSAVDKKRLYQNAASVLGLSEEEYQKCFADGQLLLEPKGEAPVLYVSDRITGTQFRLIGRTVLHELQTQRQNLSVFMQITLLLGLLASVLISWFVSKQVTKPIHQIVTTMKKIEDGDGKEKLRCPLGGTEETYQLGYEFNRLMDKVDESAHQIYLEQRQRRYNEVRLLQAQIVPHFLYNTLGMISAFIKLRRNDDAQEAIQNLANFYRMSLSRGSERITLKEEVELTRNYLSLQRMRYIEYVDYAIVHDEKASRYTIPKLLIQPLVENVLTHGLNADGRKCVIVIETNYDEENDCGVILVSDTGRGMTPERLAQVREGLEKGISMTKSVGILNVYQRMKLVYGDRFTMEVQSEEGRYTTFIMRIQGSPDVAIEGDNHV